MINKEKWESFLFHCISHFSLRDERRFTQPARAGAPRS